MRRARLSGKAGLQGGVAGRVGGGGAWVGWGAGSGDGPGLVAGLFWSWARRGAGQVVRGGWIFGVKNVLE